MRLFTTIQLEKFGDGFLHNNYIPEDELSETELLRPIPDMSPIIIPEFPSLFILPLFVIFIIAVIIGKMMLTNSS